VSRSGPAKAEAFLFSRGRLLFEMLRVADPRSFGCVFAALRRIADLQSAGRRDGLTRLSVWRPAESNSAIRQSATLRYDRGQAG
jgi:hypothetical protein